jgi:GNAT superfamily N-acetyltransferase
MAHWIEHEPVAQSRWWIAQRRGRPVGFAHARLASETGDTRLGHLRGAVEPGERHNGCGAALLQAGLAFLAEMRVAVVQVASKDPTGERFLAANGFVRRRAMRCSQLDLQSARVEPRGHELPPGTSAVPVSALSSRSVFELYSAATRDMPGDHAAESVHLERWREGWLASPELDRDCSVVLCLEDRPVAVAFMLVDAERRSGANELTGTLPDYRGRGFASAAKAASLAQARRSGIKVVYASNDEENAPMLRINARLGYRPLGVESIWERAPRA